MSALFAEQKDVGVGGGRYKGKQQDISTAGTTDVVETSHDARSALESIYLKGEQAVDKLRDDPLIEGGSTATIGIMTPKDGKFTRAQTGDTLSAVFIFDRSTNEPSYKNLTVDHSPEAERKRLKRAGCKLGQLYVDRSGDAPLVKFKPTRKKATHIVTPDEEAFRMARAFETSDASGAILSTPDVQTYDIDELYDENTRVLPMVFSDGITDALTFEEIAACVDGHSTLEAIANRIIETAKKQFAVKTPGIKGDNMSVTIAEYDPNAKGAIVLAVFDGHKNGGENVAGLLQQIAMEELKLEAAPSLGTQIEPDGPVSQEFQYHAGDRCLGAELSAIEQEYQDHIAGLVRRVYASDVKGLTFNPSDNKFEVTLAAHSNVDRLRAIGLNKSQLEQVGKTNGVARYAFTMDDLIVTLRIDAYREKHAKNEVPEDAPQP